MSPVPRIGPIVKHVIGPPPIPLNRDDVREIAGYIILVSAPALAADTLARTFLRPTPLLDIAATVLSSAVLASFGVGLWADYAQLREDLQETGS